MLFRDATVSDSKCATYANVHLVKTCASRTTQISNAGHPATNHETDQEHTPRDAPALRCIDGFG